MDYKKKIVKVFTERFKVLMECTKKKNKINKCKKCREKVSERFGREKTYLLFGFHKTIVSHTIIISYIYLKFNMKICTNT